MKWTIVAGLAVMGMLAAGCDCPCKSKEKSTTAQGTPVLTEAKQATPAVQRPTIRIKAGLDEGLVDSTGVKWAGDTGFEGGTQVDRPDLQITGTKTPELYRAERYSMDSYSVKVPNGKYVVKLHFSEDFEGIGGPEERLFTYAVRDGGATGKVVKEVKDFSPWKAAGGQFKAYVDSVPVVVTQGQITVTFVPQVENPQINALEVVPE